VLVRSADARTLHSHSVPDVTEEFRSETMERAWWADRADIVLFGIVPWGSRWQRPHHFAAELGRRGHRVVYVSPHLTLGDERWRELDEEPSQPDAVVLVQLSTWTKDTIHGSGGWASEDVGHAHHTFWRLVDELRLRCPILLAQSPAWWPLLSWIRERAEFPLVYDCLDEHTGWNEASAATLREWEERLTAEADLVLASAPALRERLQPLARNVLLVPNGCHAEHFASAAEPTNALRPPLAGPIIGYFGALSAGWFDTSLLVTLAELRPDWNFVVVGPADEETQSVLDASPNILQLGEVPYRDLPRYCADFDVATVPFLVNDLTKATDPVKLYEYFAAGKPVVTTPLPALYELQGPLAIADSPAAFEQAIESFLRDQGNRAERQAIAQAADWARRVDLFYEPMLACLPSLDVVVLTHNGVDLTRRCIASIESDPSYRATLIVVDNASTDGTEVLLDELERRADTIVLRNASNEGFAAGLNAGGRAGRGRYLLLLNNDTELPRGALLACAGGLARSREVGLLGPVTNSIGNEARIYTPYDPAEEGALDEWFRRLAWQRFGMRFDIRVAALFAAFLRREDFEAIGGIPARYQVGMFEDDELSERIRGLGKRVVCAEDVFVHHTGAASFSTLDPVVYQAIFERNKRVYERTTGAGWEPQRYRPDRARPARDPDGIELT
jgi:GT2 family glycosyltransferase/glycosyltransferase involved in cell wall biosynthesis